MSIFRAVDCRIISSLLFTGFFISSCLTSWPADLSWQHPADNAENIIAFVGQPEFVRYDPSFPSDERIAAKKTKNEAAKNDHDEIIFTLWKPRYISRFRIINPVSNNLTKEHIDFATHRHSGEPEFKDYKFALVILQQDPKRGWETPNDTVFEVHPTSDGRYAMCGNVNNVYHALEDVELNYQTINFSPPVKVNLKERISAYRYNGENADKWVKSHYSPPWYDVQGDIATCVKGVYAQDIYDAMLPTLQSES
ncbi:hypothetical protein [Robiginitomaculum antarcticum]|uniref:hypothetical protein n=1 Tax=Robiginitomaculum antarcticum TaxID=437507 RepID=UPI0003A2DE9B|nr:hypothetical protein [Robiginitomaculum antarcticum]